MKAPDNKYPVKPHRIKIYREVTEEVNGYTQVVKEYIHPQGTTLSAYVRQISAKEATNGGPYDGSVIEVVINKNKRKVDQTMFMELSGNTYQIGAPDAYEFLTNEIKFRANKTAPGEYSNIRYREWDT